MRVEEGEERDCQPLTTHGQGWLHDSEKQIASEFGVLKILSFEELARGSWLQSYEAWQENAQLAPYFSS